MNAFRNGLLILVGLGMGVMTVEQGWAKRAHTPVYENAVPITQTGSSLVNSTTGQVLFMTITGSMNPVPQPLREEFVRDYLKQHYREFGLASLPSIQLVLRQDTPGGEVLRFYQTTAGVELQENDLVAQFNPSGRLLSIHQTLSDKLSLKSSVPTVTETRAIELARSAMQVQGDNFPPVVKLQAWLSSNEVPYLIYRVTLTPKLPLGEWEAIVDAITGSILRIRETTKYIDGSGYTFDPDPLTTGQANYGATGYSDGNDADTQQLTAQRRLHVLHDISVNAGTYRLTGPWVTISDFESPTASPVTATNPDSFRYTRSPSGFEDVHVYFHLDSAQRWIQSLGFGNIQHLSIQADPHGLSGDDNSHFLPASNRLAYGEGGVDDAEDADVVWHEYGHGIQYSQVPNWGGGESGSLGEGFGDYWAGSYSASRSTFHREWVFNWDGHNTYWDGRVLNTNMVYPTNMGGSVHDNGQIWSRALMDIWDSCGREVTDKIVLQGQFAVGNGVTYPSLANAILNADLTLYNGVHIQAAYNCFHARGILNQMPNIASLNGTVTAQTSGQTITGVVVNLNGAPSDTTDSQGNYSIGNLSFTQYQVSFNHPDYNLFSTSVTISQPGVTTQNAALNRPIYVADHDSLFISVGTTDTSLTVSPLINLRNIGDGNGNFNLQIAGGGSGGWTPVRELDVGTITGDSQLFGVEVLDNTILLSGANNATNPNRFYRVSMDGVLLSTINQRSMTSSGVRDLGALNGHVYGGENDTIWRWNADFSNEQFVCRTIINPPRGIAVQQSATQEPVIWICDNTQSVRKFSAYGTLISSATNTYFISGVAAMPNENEQVWFVSCDNSYSQLWVNTLNEAGTAVVRLAQLELPAGYRSAGACFTLDEFGDVGQLAILLYSNSPARAILRFYNVPTPATYATFTSSSSGTLAPGDSIPVSLALRLDQARQRFSFTLQQANSPGRQTIARIVVQRSTGAHEQIPIIPQSFTVSQAYPNPFNRTANLRVTMPEAGTIELAVFDILGRAAMNRSFNLPSGMQTVQVNFSNYSAGTYFTRITYRNHSTMQRWIFLK